VTLITPDLNYSCTMCGGCCKRWGIDAEDAVRADIGGTALKDANGGKTFRRIGGRWYTEMTSGGECVFLMDNACRIHGELGGGRKPLTCMLFPYMFADTPDGAYVGVSFACPSVLANEGAPVREDAGLEGLLEEARKAGKVRNTKPTLYGCELPWATYMMLESKLAELFAGAGTVREALILGFILVRDARARTDGLDVYLQDVTLDGLRRGAGDGSYDPAVRKSVMAACLATQLMDKAGGAASLKAVSNYLNILSGSKPVAVGAFGVSVVPDRLLEVEWSESELVGRYFRHLVFRKALASGGDVYDSICLMVLSYASVEWYAKAAALGTGRRSVNPGDIARAVGLVERGFVTHDSTYSRVLNSMFTGPMLHKFFRSGDFAEDMLSRGIKS
jgi:Fe-S-cluster containining protein